MSKARQLADLGNAYSDGGISGSNLVINGGMTVSQRGNSTSVTATGYYGPDRFYTVLNSAGTWSVSQSSTAPDGFGSSLKFDCTTANASLSSGAYLILYYTFEGQDLQRLKKGTSSAEKSTLSFWIRSNKTGTYQVNMQDQDNSRLTGKTYTIDAANTWERKVITFDGDTTGAYDNDANASLTLEWWFAAGSDFTGGAVPTSWEALAQADRAAALNVNLADSTSNELYITGVMLEIGDSSTPFEHRSYGDQLQACQRYYAQGGVILSDATPDRYHNTINLPCEMRAQPTISSGGIDSGSGGTMVSTWDSSNSSTSKRNFYQGANNSVISNSWFAFDAEL